MYEHDVRDGKIGWFDRGERRELCLRSRAEAEPMRRQFPRRSMSRTERHRVGRITREVGGSVILNMMLVRTLVRGSKSIEAKLQHGARTLNKHKRRSRWSGLRLNMSRPIVNHG